MSDFDERYGAIKRNMADYSNQTSVPQGRRFIYAYVDLTNRIIHLGKTISPVNVASYYHAFRRKYSTAKLPAKLKGSDKNTRLLFFIKDDPDGSVYQRIMRPNRLWWHRQ
jgi:hypothetical protein